MTIVNFDQAATSFPKPESVYDTMDQNYRQAGWSIGRSNLPLENQLVTVAAIQDTRRLLCELFETSKHEVVFTATATEAINVILKGLSISHFKQVYTTPFEHRSVTVTLAAMGHISRDDDSSQTTSYLAFDTEQLVFDMSAIEAQFRKAPPSLVILCHLSNVLGVLAPINRIVELAKSYGALVIIDACQSAGRVPLRATADFVVFSGHKSLMGPFGIAGFLMPLGFSLKPLIHGGNGRDLISSGNSDLPLEVGTQNSIAILGLRSGLQWVQAHGVNDIYEHESTLSTRLYTLLAQQPFLMPIHEASPYRPFGIVSCKSKGISLQALAQLLIQQGILIRLGLHCSDAAHLLMGTWDEGLLRFSINAMTTDSDFECLEQALSQIQELL